MYTARSLVMVRNQLESKWKVEKEHFRNWWKRKLREELSEAYLAEGIVVKLWSDYVRIDLLNFTIVVKSFLVVER